MATASPVPPEQQCENLYADGFSLRAKILQASTRLLKTKTGAWARFRRKNIGTWETTSETLQSDCIDYESRVHDFVKLLDHDGTPVGILNPAVRLSELLELAKTLRALLSNFNGLVSERRSQSESTLNRALNVSLLFLTVLSLVFAYISLKATYDAGQKQAIAIVSQQNALKTLLESLNGVSSSIKGSAQDLKDSAKAATGQYNLLVEQRSERDIAVSFALKDELETNLRVVSGNLTFLKEELAALDKNQSMVGPLKSLQSGAWDLLKVYIPPKLSQRKQTIQKLEEVAYAVARINEEISSRESYRISNGAMDNYTRRMKIYDQILEGELTQLMKMLLDVIPIILF